MPSLDDIVAGGGSATDEEVLLDLSGAVEFERIPDGEYRAVVRDVQKGSSKAGNPTLDWVYVLTEEGAQKNRERKRKTPLTGKGAGLSKQAIRATGEELETNDSGKVKLNLAAYRGKEVVLVISQQPGTDFDQIEKVKPVPASL